MRKRAEQAKLCFEASGTPKIRRTKTRNWDAENCICAEIILAYAERFGGSEALPVIWAQQVRDLDAVRIYQRSTRGCEAELL